MTNKRKIEMFDELLFYITELIHDEDDTRHTLHAIGFTEIEISEILFDTHI